MRILENEFRFTNFSRGQSNLMMKCVAVQALRNWLEIFSTYLEIDFSDDEVIMEAELNEL